MYIITWDSGITQPKDKGILLKDIIENGEVDRNKSCCLLAGYDGKFTPDRYLEKGIHQGIITDGAIRGRGEIKNTQQKLEINETGKSNALTSVFKDSLCIEFKNPPHNNKFKQTATFHVDSKKSNTLLAYAGDKTRGIGIHDDSLFWRKLTPIECERLQTVPDNYTNHVSNSQRYKMLGNGWTVDVIAHIFKNINELS